MSGSKGLGASISFSLALVLLGATAGSAQETDDPSRQVAAIVPEYGGSFWRGDALVINLTRNTPETLERSHRALIRFGGSDFDVSEVVGREVKFTWSQLQGWFESFLRSPAIEGVTGIDHSHRLNRVSIGIERESVRPAVEARTAELGIPPEAAVVSVEPRTVPIPGDPELPPYGLYALVLAGLVLVATLALVARRARAHRSADHAEDSSGENLARRRQRAARV
jgi:hypothetical protein